uniref:Uncharacterized protein n=1 Tax=Arundo donax TaxID=35708 RepID=A0A0A9AVG1_ARUDO
MFRQIAYILLCRYLFSFLFCYSNRITFIWIERSHSICTANVTALSYTV